MNKLDWNYERYRTRDRLYTPNYDDLPPLPYITEEKEKSGADQ